MAMKYWVGGKVEEEVFCVLGIVDAFWNKMYHWNYEVGGIFGNIILNFRLRSQVFPADLRALLHISGI